MESNNCGRQEPNDCGKRELNDCSVAALASCKGLSYPWAYKTMQSYGREEGKPVTATVLLNAYLRSGLLLLPRMQPEDMKAKLKSGRYIIWCKGHVFCVIDGIMQDKVAPKGDTEVVAVFEMKN